MPNSEPKTYSDAVLYEYMGDVLAAAAKDSLHGVDVSVMLEIGRRFRELIDAERKRKGRPTNRPRVSTLGEDVEEEAQKKVYRGNVTKARQAFAMRNKLSQKTVTQAHVRFLKRRALLTP